MAGLEDALAQAISLVGAIAGINFAPNHPPENAADFPFVTAFPGTGRYVARASATQKKAVHTAQLEVHVSRQMLPDAMEQIWPLADDVADVLMNNPTLTSTVDTIIMSDDTPITYTFGASEWAGVETLAFIFQVPFKQITDTT